MQRLLRRHEQLPVSRAPFGESLAIRVGLRMRTHFLLPHDAGRLSDPHQSVARQPGELPVFEDLERAVVGEERVGFDQLCAMRLYGSHQLRVAERTSVPWILT